MKQLTALIILLIVGACDDEGGNSTSEDGNLPFTKENILGIWELQSRIIISYNEDMTIAGTDTAHYDYIIDLSSDNLLTWSGTIYYEWGNDDRQRTEYGNGEGIWLSINNEIDNNIINEVEIYLDDVYRWEEDNRTQNLSAIGIIDELTNKNMRLVRYINGPDTWSRADYFNLIRIVN